MSWGEFIATAGLFGAYQSSANDFINHIMTFLVAPLLVNNSYDNFKTINIGVRKMMNS